MSLNDDDKYLYDLNGIHELEYDTGLDIDSFYNQKSVKAKNSSLSPQKRFRKSAK